MHQGYEFTRKLKEGEEMYLRVIAPELLDLIDENDEKLIGMLLVKEQLQGPLMHNDSNVYLVTKCRIGFRIYFYKDTTGEPTYRSDVLWRNIRLIKTDEVYNIIRK